MAYGANCIPGGNDALLLWFVPSLARFEFVAYTAMLVTLIAAFWAGQLFWLRRQ